MLLIDGTNCVLGRLATHVAKKALDGESVKIFNAEKIIITGNAKQIIDDWKTKRKIKSSVNPAKSPKFPRRPDLFVKKTIRGMLPRHSSRGREAFNRIRVFMGAPASAQGVVKIAECNSGLKVSVGELCRALGWNE